MIAFVLVTLLGLATASSRSLAKRTLHPYSPRWVGRYPAHVVYAGLWTYAAWLLTCVYSLVTVKTGRLLVATCLGLEGVAVTALLVLAAQRQRAPASWTRADYDRFMAADSPRWWRREQERRRLAEPAPEDYERMRQMEDAILGPPEAPPLAQRQRRRPPRR